MPTVLTPATPPTYAANYSAPADGDNGSASSVDTCLQQALNATEASRQVLVSTRLAPRYESRDGINITVQALGNVLITSATVWGVYPHAAATTFDPTVSLGVGLGNSTKYYIYATQTAGVVTFIASTTAPDVQLEYSSAPSTDNRFVGFFFTENTGLIVPFTCYNGKFRYAAQATSAALDNAAYPVGGDSGYSTLRISNLAANSNSSPAIPGVPTFAKNVVLNWAMYNTNGTGFIVSLWNPNASGMIGAGVNPYFWFAKAPDMVGAEIYLLMGSVDYCILNSNFTVKVVVTGYSTGRFMLATAGFDY